MLFKKKYNIIQQDFIKGYNAIREKSKRNLLCHAPFKSIFFSEYGEVLACFYNKKEILGRYPENSIHDIWNGKKINKLRDYIKNNDLSFGCEDCRRYLIFKNYYSVGAWKYDYLPKAEKNFPVSLDFQISNICNLECIMCNGEFSASIRQKREREIPYSNPYDKIFIKQLEPFFPHLKEAAFTGGETFLVKLYYDIWNKISEINPEIKISITTNGTILNEKIKKILSLLNFNITISVDAISKETFELIRKGAKFETVLENLNYFHEYTLKKNTTFTVKTCPMRQNWKELPQLFKFLNDKNIVIVYNTVVFPPYCSLWNIAPEKSLEIIKYLSSFNFEATTIIQQQNIERYKNLIVQLQNWRKEVIKNNYDEILKLKDHKKLLQIFYKKIRNAIYQDITLSINEKEEKHRKYDEALQQLSDAIENKESLANALKYYIGLPIERILSEMEIRSVEKMIERTKQAGKIIE